MKEAESFRRVIWHSSMRMDFYIVGRKKRLLKIYGNCVNLDEIDRKIKGIYEDIDVASAGVDDHIVYLPDKTRDGK